jgi:dihydroflavonol-4-reductase
MDVFMTGANGFVGLNIVSALVAAGHRVTAYVRTGSNTSFLEPFGVRIVRGSLDDAAALTAAMRGAEAVIHTAGNTSCNRRDLPALLAANVHGTRNVVDAAVATGVSRIVYTSTTSTIGATAGADRPSDESTPLRGFRARSPYAITKQRAEEIILSARPRGVQAIILNLAEVIGPYDYTLQWGRMVLAVQHDQVPFVPPGGGSFCAATEVGRAHVSALTRGRSGERYILGGADASYASFIDAAAQVLGKSCRLPRTNYTWLYAKALLQDKLPALVPGQPIVEPYRMRVFGGTYRFDSAKAVRELGYECAPLTQMLRECAHWYRRNGYFGAPDPIDITPVKEERATWIPEH